ncbi:MAG: AbrB/MazE/SpoVT family DNA-binding domain-containing protein [Syntrophothermus sp.]
MYKSKITSKGQVTIPVKLREKMGLRPGDEIQIRETQAGYIIEKHLSQSPFDKYVGYLSEKKGQDPDTVVEEMRGR